MIDDKVKECMVNVLKHVGKRANELPFKNDVELGKGDGGDYYFLLYRFCAKGKGKEYCMVLDAVIDEEKRLERKLTLDEIKKIVDENKEMFIGII